MEDGQVTPEVTPQPQPTPTPQPIAEPAFNPEMIRTAIHEGLREIASQAPVQPQQVPQPQVDPVGQVLNPYLAPVNLQVQSAIDSSQFYARTKVPEKYIDEIEQTHRQWLAQGITVSRSEVWNYIKGKYQDQMFTERQQAAQEAATRAQEEQSLGIGSPARYMGPPKDARELSHEELTNSLDGVSF